MNKIYKVIWSKAKHTYVVTSEIAKSHAKAESTGKGLKKLALALLAVLAITGPGYATAADYVTVKDTSGTEQTVYTKDGVDNQLKDLAKQTDVDTNKNNISTLQSNTQGISHSDYYSGTTTIDNNLQVNKSMLVSGGIIAGKNVQAKEFITNPVQTTNEYGAVTSIDQLTIEGSTIQGGTATKNVQINSKNNVSLTAGTRQTNTATVSGGNVVNQASYAILNNAGTGIQNNVSGDNGYISNSAAQIKSVATKTITEQVTGTDSEGNPVVLNEVKSDGNGTTFTNSDSSTTIKGNAISTGSIDATGNITAASADVKGKLTADSASVTNSISVGHNANVGGAVNAGSLNSRGNLNVDGNALVKGTLTSQSTINGKEIVSQTNITAKNKVVGMQGVVDNTLTDGTYVTAGNTVGQNINALDEQVRTNVETANQLQHSLAAEATAREAADTAINNKLAQDKTDTALHVTKDGNLIVGTKENQTVKDVKIRGQLTSGSVSTGNITSTGDVSVAGKVEAGAVYDDTTKTGNYVVQTNSVGSNLSALDTQVKSNADAITAETTAREEKDNELNERITNEANAIHETTNQLQSDLSAEAATRESKDNELNERITNEANAIHDEIKAGDNALNDRITAVKESLQQEAADTYVSKDDASVEDGYVIKKANKIGENVALVDKALSDEVAARVTADKAQNEAIATVNSNLVTAVNTINQNMSDGFAALNQADANEAAAREAADDALDSRTSDLEAKTEAITYDKDSKTVMVDGKLTATEGITDGTTQDGQYVKMDNYVGQNLNALDQGLQAETMAREAADTAEAEARQAADKTLQDNIDAEAATRAAEDKKLNKKITAEKKSRIAADTKLVEAVNSGLSLSGDNVLQKNTTTIDAKGNVTTSRTDANEMILNKGKDNQITMNESGIKVGTNSTVVDKDGVYTGGDTYSEAKAALKSDGSIKGADGKFTVNSVNGTVNVNDQIELNGATGVVKSNGLNVGDGNMTVSSNGNIKSAGTLSVADGNFKVNSNGGVSAAGGKTTLASDGSIKAADGKFTVNSNGGVKAADGKITLSSDGSVKAADGKFTVNSNGAVKAADGKFTVDSNGAVSAANGNTTIDSNGNLSTRGTVSAANGKFSVDTNGKITSTGLDAGSGTIQTTGTVQAGDVKTGTLETTGDATIGGNLTVEKNLTVNGEFNAKTLSSKLDENNYTEIHGGNVTSKNLKYSATGELQASSSKMDETGSTVWARDDESIGTSTVTADSVKQSLSDTGDNPTNYAFREIAQNGKNTYEMTDSVVEGNQSNITKTTADTTDSQIALKDDDGNVLNKSYITQNLKKIIQGVEEGDSKTTIEQDANNITNTAANGTITNDADKILNKGATSITSQIGDGSAVKTVMDANGIANTAIGGTISNEAKNITNTASGDITNTAKNGTITNDAKDIVNKASGNMTTTVGGEMSTTVTGKVTEDYKSDLSTKVGGNETHAVTGSQTVTVSKDRTVNVKGTETENFNAQVTNIKTDQKTSVGGNQTNIVGGDQQNTVSGNKLETVKGAVTEKYGSQATTIDGDQSTNIGGSQSTVVAGDQTNTVSGNKTESVKGDVNESYGSLTTNVKNDSSLTAENINNTARNKITNKALDVETDASSSIVNKVSNDYGTNTSTQTSSQTLEEMSEASGKTASYLRGAGEQKSQLTDGDTKTTIDTIAGQTNTNITDGTNTSNDLQKADQIASSVTDGTNTTVVNQDAKSLASSITDGTKSNSSSSTVDKSEQVIKASDTQYSASTKTATKSEEALVNGSTILDIVKDSSTGTISAAVTDGTNLTGSTMTAKGITNSAAESIVNEIGDGSKVKSEMTESGITNTAKDGTITNDAKDVLNKGTNSVINEVGDNQVAVKTDSVKAAYGSDTSTTWDAKGITSTTSGDISNTASGSMTNTIGKDLTTTVGGNQKTTVTGNSELTAENVKAIGKTSITSQIGEGDNPAVKTVMNADGIANTAAGGTISNDAKDIRNTATGDITNSAANGTISNTADKIANTAATSITDKVGDKVSRTMTATSIEDKVGTTTVTTTDGLTKLTNEDGTHKTQMDFAEVLKDLGIRGNAAIDGDTSVGGNLAVTGTSTLTGDVTMKSNATVEKNLTVNGTSDLKGDVTMESNATVKKDLTVEGATTTKTLKVTDTSEFDGAATFNDIVTMNKGLSVTGGVTADTVTADSYKVGDKTYIDSNGINANNQKVTNVADGDISEGSTDAVNGGQLHATNTRVANVENRVTQVETRVDKLDNKIDKVGANAAAMANLHPLEFDADSKWNIAAAVGNSGSETASAVGVFYRPNEDVMVNASAAMGTGENMFGGGVSVRLGHGGNKAKAAQMKAAAAENRELRAQVNDLTARMDALLSVLNPNMSKEFPDVPANHWAYEAVSRLAGNGIVEGYEDGKYHGERQMTRYEMAEIIYNALSKGAKAEKKLVEEFRPELQAMAAQKKA